MPCRANATKVVFFTSSYASLLLHILYVPYETLLLFKMFFSTKKRKWLLNLVQKNVQKTTFVDEPVFYFADIFSVFKLGRRERNNGHC